MNEEEYKEYIDDIFNTYSKAGEIIKHFGVRSQLKKLSEEIYELQEAVIELETNINGRDTKHVEEELADVMNILRQIQIYYDLNGADIEKTLTKKVNRTLERIKDNYYEK